MALKSTAFLRSIDAKSVGEERPAFQLGEAIDVARARSGFTHSQLCAYMDNLDRGTWSKQIDGDGHISFGRLLKCPDAFWHELLPILAAHYGMRVSTSTGVSQTISRALISLAAVIATLEMATHDQKAG
jgi:hypothetical protein